MIPYPISSQTSEEEIQYVFHTTLQCLKNIIRPHNCDDILLLVKLQVRPATLLIKARHRRCEAYITLLEALQKDVRKIWTYYFPVVIELVMAVM